MLHKETIMSTTLIDYNPLSVYKGLACNVKASYSWEAFMVGPISFIKSEMREECNYAWSVRMCRCTFPCGRYK